MTSSEESQAKPDDRLRRGREFIAKIALSLLLGFLLTCAIGYIVGYSTLLSSTLSAEARFFIKDILFALGTACAVSLIFGFLLELPTTTDYVAEKLSDLIFGDAYLRRITNSLPAFRRRIDRVLFGETEVASHHSLYNFMEGRLQALYRTSFRRNMSVEMRCIEEPNDYLLWLQKTWFTFVKNPLDLNESTIRSMRTLDVPRQLLPASSSVEKARFNEIVLRLYVRVGEHEYESSANDRTVLTRIKKTNLPAAMMEETIKVEYDFKHGKLNYSFGCSLPRELLVHDTEVIVEFHDDHRTLREAGNLVYAGVAAPTEDFSLDCFFPDGTRLEPARFFWQGLQKMADVGTESGAISVKIPGWLLQGEGACVAWFLPPKAESATRRPDDFRAKPPDVSET